MMPMIKIGKDTKNIKIGDRNISKVYKGYNLIWEKIKFNGFQIVTFGSVNFNGGYKDKLPLNVPLKLRIRNNKQIVNAKVDYKAEQRMYSGAVFMLKTEKVFTISTNGMLDIEIKQTSEQPEHVFE